MAQFPAPEVTQPVDIQPTLAPPAVETGEAYSEADSPHLKSWGDFQLLQRLGRGGFGEVYRAWDPVLEREVALKLLLPRGLDPDQEFATIVAEARAIARVRHPNIVSVYGVDRREGRVGFWSDFVRGQTLSALIAAEGPMDEKTAARIGVVLCEALAAVHSAGLLHRDIKAGNAMRDENGRVLLMDFGLSQDLLGVSNIAGTPGYLAPEVRAGHPASVQSDLYAMGVLLRFLTTGEHSPGPATIAPLQHSGGLVQIVRKATDPDPKLRYASAAQMEKALAALIQAAPDVNASMAGTPPSRWKRHWIAGLTLLVLAAGIALAPRFLGKARNGAPSAGSPAYQDYLAAEDALLRYDKTGNTDKAIALYLSALRRNRKYALAEAGLARAYWRKYLDFSESKWADAATQASAKAMEMNPELAPVQMTAGMIHVDQGKFDVGLQELQQGLQLDPRSADAHAAMGEAYRQQGRLADAKNELQTAMDLAPENWRWPYLLGALQIDSGDFRSAEQNMNVALAKTQDNARILYNLGIVYRKEDRLMEAQTALEKSIAPDGRADPMMELGQVSLQRGEYQNAIDWFLRAVQLSPSDYDAWGNLAAAYQGSGQHPTEAANAYRKAAALAEEELKTTPDKSFLVSVLGEYYANLHDESHALPLLRRAVVLAPEDPDLLERVGESYEDLGHRGQALSFVVKALKLGFPLSYARSEPALKALRQDPHAPEAIREPRTSNQQNGGKL
jgi:tetratricopeptide (TPR) repeat protein